MPPCPPPAELSSLLLGRLSSEKAEVLEQHVETCISCQDTVRTLNPSADWLAEGVRVATGVNPALEPACQEAISRIRKYAPEATQATMAAAPKTIPTSAGVGTEAPTADFTSELGTIREYKLLSKLGEGGMGAVYKAQHTKLRRTVALKVLPWSVANSPGVIARFEREMQAVGALDHEHIVRAFDAGESEGRHYLVMEYVKGRDLTQLCRDAGRLSIPDACELVRQAAIGLQHAHEAGLVHRDIKPSNLMLSDAGVVKILDLGLALLNNADGSGELTSTGQVMGTIEYMAPEQGGDTHHVDIRADIYSLGATLYRLLSGIAPFGDPKFDTPVKKLMALATQEPMPVTQRRSDIPPALAAIIAKMMAKSPDKRYRTPAELVTALAPFAASSNLPQLAAKTTSDQAGPVVGEAETQPSLKSASVDTILPALPPAKQSNIYWQRFQTLPFYVRWLALTALALAGGGAAAWALSGIVLLWETPQGTVRIEILDDKIQAQFDKEGLVVKGADKEPIKLHIGKEVKAGTHRLVVKRGDFEFETKTFELKNKGQTTIKIELIADRIVAMADGQPIGEKQLTPSLAGEWTTGGEHRQNDFGTIRLTTEGTEYRGTYSATYDKKPGALWLKPAGDGKYEGTWSESNKIRRGTLKAELSADRQALRVEWEATDEEGTKSSSPFKRGVSEWRRLTPERQEGAAANASNRYASQLDGSGEPGLDFDGVDDYIELPRLATRKEGPITVEAWLTPLAWEHHALMNASGRRPFSLYTDKGVVGFWCLGKNVEMPAPAELLGKPVHIAGVYDDVGLTVYLNGQPSEQVPPTVKTADETLTAYIGALRDWQQDFLALRGFFRGRLHAIRVSEIARYSKTFAPQRKLEPDANTLAFYRFDEGAGDVLKDSSGNNHQGKIVGAKWVRTNDSSASPRNTLDFNVREGAGTARVAISKPLSVGKPCTIEMYVTLRSAAKANRTLFDAGGQLLLKQEGSDLVWHGPAKRPVPGYSRVVAKGIVNAGQRRHIAAISTGAELSVFVDGHLIGRMPVESEKPSGAPYYVLGGMPVMVSGWEPLDGLIDQVRISTTARYQQDFSPDERLAADQDTLALFHFDEGSGEVLQDSSGNNHHGKIVGARWVRPDVTDIEHAIAGSQSSYELSFESGDGVKLPDVVFEHNTPITIEGFFTPTNPEPGKVARVLGADFHGCFLQEFGTWGFGWITNDFKKVSGPAWTPNHRVHVAGVRTADKLLLFIDGKLVANQTVGISRDNVKDIGLGGDRFVGRMDEIRISKSARYDRTFTPVTRFQPDADTLALYHCDEGSGNVLKDSSGNSYHGKIEGAKWVKTGTAAPPVDADANFVRMFNDKDLEGWEALRSGSIQWTNEGGAITGRNRSAALNSAGVLRSSKLYKDFHFRCEVLAGVASEPALLFRNVGNLVRGSRHGYALSNPAPTSPTIAEGWGYGSLYADNFQVPLSETRLAPSAEKDLGIKTGDWYRLEIIAQGETIEIRVNDKRTAHYTSSDPALNKSGAFAIRCGAGATVALRNLEIKELSPGEQRAAEKAVSSAPSPADAPFDAAWTKVPETTNSIGMKFVRVPQGKSWLGGGAGQPGSRAIEFKEDFYLGSFTVTQEEWQKVMGNNPSHFSRNGERKAAVKEIPDADLAQFPVEDISFADAQAFLAKLNDLDRQPGWEYRLPTSDEWEYACRGGPLSDPAESAFSFYAGTPANDLPPNQANFAHKEGLQRTVKVGQFAPNKLGLFDMHGNVLEWCSDASKNEAGQETRLVRGGSWNNPPGAAASRLQFVPTVQYASLGLRVVRARVNSAPMPPSAIAPFDAAQAKAHQESWAKHLGVPVEYTNSAGIKFKLIPPGQFVMGSPESEAGRETIDKGSEKQHEVEITRPYYLGTYEVTQEDYVKLMGKNPSAQSAGGKDKNRVKDLDTRRFPVESVSWNDAKAFCQKLSELKGEQERTYRLPTEAEWEYAFRAGTTTVFYVGDTLTSHQGNFIFKFPYGTNVLGPDAKHLTPVGSYASNPFGLYDMIGNVCEWCEDAYDYRSGYYARSPKRDPWNKVGTRRARRGGSASAMGTFQRAAERYSEPPGHTMPELGFRVVLEIDEALRQRISQQAAPARAVAPFDAAQAQAHQEAWAKHLGVPVEYTNSIGMKFRLVPPGEFMMGSTPEQIEAALRAVPAPRWGEEWRECVRSEGPQHKVILTRPYYLGSHEVTQTQYEKILGKNPSAFSATGYAKKQAEGLDTGDFPVDSVTWKDAAEFCVKLSQREELPAYYTGFAATITAQGGAGYRLPTEAEWEFACRAGTTSIFCSGETEKELRDVAWCWPFAERPHAVGELKANALGLFDMHGNVWEWVEDVWQTDYYAQFKDGDAIDPKGPQTPNGKRIIRGGTNALASNFVRSANRSMTLAKEARGDRGFRVALSVEAVRQALDKLPPAGAKEEEADPDSAQESNRSPTKIGELSAEVAAGKVLAPDLSQAKPARVEEMDGLTRDFRVVARSPRWRREYVDGKYLLENQGGGFSAFANPLTLGEGGLELELEFLSDVPTQWTLALRSANREVLISLTNEGSAEIVSAQGKEVTQWQAKPAALKPGAAQHQLLLVLRNDTLETYVNGVALVDPLPFPAAELPTGTGMQLRTRGKAGVAIARFRQFDLASFPR